MRYQVTIRGTRPLITNNGPAGLDTRSPANVEKAEISRKKGSNRTAADDERLRELDCLVSLWLDASGAPTIPERAIRKCIEDGAKQVRQRPQVRMGLVVEGVQSFDYDREALGSTVEELGKRAQFTVAVVIGRARVLKTRAKFDEWSCVCTLDCDDEQVDQAQLEQWLDIAGRRIGLGDWRPATSGTYGRFEAEVQPL